MASRLLKINVTRPTLRALHPVESISIYMRGPAIKMGWLWVVVVCAIFRHSHQHTATLRYPVVQTNVSASTDHIRVSLTPNVLSCFVHNDSHDLSLVDMVMCLVPPFSIFSTNCHGIWGSRSLMIHTSGSVELLRVQGGMVKAATTSSLLVEHWMEIGASIHKNELVKEILQIPSEPFVLCARSTDLFGRNSSFEMSFRDAFIRDKDMYKSKEKVIYHTLTLLMSSSALLLPYFLSLLVASIAFSQGIQFMIVLLTFSGLVVCLTPFMLTKRNREILKLYLKYFFSPTQLAEARALVKTRRATLHALYLSCVVMFFGSISVYLVYHYVGIHREIRNSLLNAVIALSTSWFAFFLGRLLDSVVSHWAWIGLVASLFLSLRSDINPQCEWGVAFVLVGFSVFTVLVFKKIFGSHSFVQKNFRL